MTAPACRKGLRRKNGRKANFRQVQTSAARSFGSQSNQIINTASVRNARRFPHLFMPPVAKPRGAKRVSTLK